MCLLVEFLLAVTVTLKQHLTAQVTQRIQVLSFSFTPQYFSHLSMSHYQILHSCRIMSMGTQGLMEGSRMVPTNRKVQSGCETGVLFKMICWEGVQYYEKISQMQDIQGLVFKFFAHGSWLQLFQTFKAVFTSQIDIL